MKMELHVALAGSQFPALTAAYEMLDVRGRLAIFLSSTSFSYEFLRHSAQLRDIDVPRLGCGYAVRTSGSAGLGR